MPARKRPQKKPRPRSAGRLEKYRKKRDFAQSPEPDADEKASGGKLFVVQEHHARSHHFDFRMEMDGVLVSWAVPKGIPEDLAAKRLAVHVEDHPLEYGVFEGEIPKGNYGAGAVKIWDRGKWAPVGLDWRRAMEKGKLKFRLSGGRLRGCYLLARMGEEPNWLMRKIEDEAAVLPGSDLEREEARFVSPQLARVTPSVPEGSEWIHEIKYDGYRMIAVARGGDVRMFTRSGIDWTHKFQGVVRGLAKLAEKDFVMDGEAVVFDAKGRSRFGGLQAALQAGGTDDSVHYVVFDLLHWDGVNVRDLALRERIHRLAQLVGGEPGVIMCSKTWEAEMGLDLFKQACATGLEGIISKKAGGRYLEGERRDWMKAKCRARQEFVVWGYTPPKGSLKGFGALLLATYEHGRLVPRGKVGTGFSDRKRMELMERFQPLRAARPVLESSERDAVWLEPRLVAEVEFAEITRDGAIRQGSFVALREDKPPDDVHIEGVLEARADGSGGQVDGVEISHPERLVYPADGVTKLEVARYYERVGEWMMPFVGNHPLAVIRAPDGITGGMFFQKSFPHVPAHVRQQSLDDGTSVFSVRDVRGLIALAQFGTVEFHPWGAPLPDAGKPDFLIWDLDPDAAVPWNEVLGAALLLRDFLQEHDLFPLVKTSGGKGLHVVLPVKRTQPWEVMREFTRTVAQEIAAYNPKRFLIKASKAKRVGRIFIDWMRNGRGATCVAPWSLRARPGATVSMPVEWDDLPKIRADGFTLREPSRVPEGWTSLRFQTVGKAVLRKLGVSL